MTNWTLLGLLALSVLVAAASLTPVEARALARRDGDDNDDKKGNRKDRSDLDDDDDEREMEIEIDDYEVKFKSEQKINRTKTELEFKLELEDEPQIQIRVETEEGDIEIDERVKVEFLKLYEFTDSDNTAGFSVNDTVVNEYDLKDDYTWEHISCDNSAITSNLTTCNMTSTDGSIKIMTELAGHSFEVTNTIIPPTTCKITVILKQAIGAENYLALRVRTRSRTKQERERDHKDERDGDDHTKSVDFGVSDTSKALAFFSWSTTFVDQSNNTVHTVLSSPFKSEGDEGEDKRLTTVFSFMKAGAGDIFWDPQLGYGSSVPNTSTSSASFTTSTAFFAGVAAVGTVLIVVGAILYKRHKNRIVA